MREFLETYEIELWTKSPLYIGSGQDITKKEYVFLKNKKIGVMNPEKLYQMIKGKRLIAEYEGFLLANQRKDLTRWLREHRFEDRDLNACMSYELDAGDAVIDSSKTLQIQAFTKDPYGCPYVPGSSLKGMLRTILLGSALIENPGNFQRERGQLLTTSRDTRMGKNVFSREIAGLEARQYRTLSRNEKKPGDAVNDVLAGLHISDSAPMKIEDLTLCQRIEMHRDGKERKLNILRESIKPERNITFQITFDRKLCKITPTDIVKAIDIFHNRYYESFSGMFPHVDRPQTGEVFFGGGVGFLSKTIIYDAFSKKDGIELTKRIFEKTKVPRIHKHDRDTTYGVSPHVLKCTQYQGKQYQMGRCLFVIK